MWKTIGQPRIVDLLQRAVERGKLSHAYLLAGPPQVGKMRLALDLAMTLNCQAVGGGHPCGECLSCRKISEGKHPDVQVVGLNQGIEPEGSKERTEIGIEQIKDMLHSVSLPPFEGLYRVYIIDEAGHLSPDAANRLLKTLEEPTGRVVFILLTVSVRSIPATVISRCQKLNLSRLKASEVESALTGSLGVETGRAKLLSKLSHGCLGWAIEASKNADLSQERSEQFEKMLVLIRGNYTERFAIASQLALQFGKKRDTVYETLDTWAGWWRDILLAKTGCSGDIVSIDFMPALAEVAGTYKLVQIKKVIEDISQASEQLKMNANARLVLEALMLNIPRMITNKTGQAVN